MFFSQNIAENISIPIQSISSNFRTTLNSHIYEYLLNLLFVASAIHWPPDLM